MTERIIFAGSGGQGIMLLGKILAEAAMREDKKITWFPCYGAEVRGGSAYCMVIISDHFIASPYIEKADTLIIMNKISLQKFLKRVSKKGIIFFNSSLGGRIPQTNVKFYPLAFTENAFKLGNIRVANMIALGSYLKVKPILSLKRIYEVIEEFPLDQELKGLNKKAIEIGMNLI